MVVQVHKVGDEFMFRLPPQAAEELDLIDGSKVDIRLAEPESATATRYASIDEVMKIHREMEPHHAEAYRELAK